MSDAIDLDSPYLYVARDPSRFGERLFRLPQTARIGWMLGEQATLPRLDEPPARVLIAAVGGSAIGGELIRGLTDFEEDASEIVCWKDLGLPEWARQDTLVVAISVSGSTAETRSALSEAAGRGMPAIAITGPGRMQSEARAAGVPILEIDYTGEPRTGLGYTFLAPYRMLQRLSLVPDASHDFEAAIQSLEARSHRWGPASPVRENLAKQLALELENRIPVIWGARHLMAVAMRWKTQFNENADSAAYWEPLPEATHNAVQGLSTPDSQRAALSSLILGSPRYPEVVTARVEATQAALSQLGLTVQMVESESHSRLGEILELTLLGDMVSYYLSVIRGRDPSRTSVLDSIKRAVRSLAAAH